MLEGQRLKPGHEPYVTAVKPMPVPGPAAIEGRASSPPSAQGLGGGLFFQNKVTRQERRPRR